jgi:TolA-binding protein
MAQRAKNYPGWMLAFHAKHGIWPIAGGSSNDAPPSNDNDDDDKGGDNDQGAGGTNDDDKDGSQSGARDVIDPEEHEKVKERMKAADRRASQVEQELEELRQFKKEIESQNQSETERLQNDLSEVTERAETLETRAKAAEGRLGIVLANGKRDKPFRDADDVLRWIDVDDVTNDKGEIDDKALTEALDALAEDKPYLLADTGGDDEEDDDAQQRSSGAPFNSNKNKGKGGLDRETLAKKYPALRR